MSDPAIPETGAVFTFGKSKFADNISSCFWLKNDRIISISCGDEHTALVTEAGKVYVFGSNDWGQLGLGHTHAVYKPTCIKTLKMHKAKMVACGRNHTLVGTYNNKLFTFGNNGDAQLGIGSTDNSSTAVEVDSSKLGSIKLLDAGADFSVALTDDGDLYVWGSNAEGQLGIGSEVNEVTQPTLLNVDYKIVWVSCGYYHMAVVSESGDLYTFGEDENGKLGERENPDSCVPSKVVTNKSLSIAKVSCGGSHTAFITRGGDVYSFGDGTHGQLGHGADVLHSPKPRLVERLKQHKVIQISCGENFTSAVTEKGRLYTFGDGRHGKLALGEESFTNQFKPYRCTKFTDYRVSFATCGGCHLMVLAKLDKKSVDIDLSDSEEEDPMLTINMDKSASLERNFLSPKENIDGIVNGDIMNKTTSLTNGVSLSRSLSAREKRRQGRPNMMSQTLPPLKTFKHVELMEVAKSLPKLTPAQLHEKGLTNDWSKISEKQNHKKEEEDDTISEISTFNKVHVLTTIGDTSTLTPIRPKREKGKEKVTKDPSLQSGLENGEARKTETKTEVVKVTEVKQVDNSDGGGGDSPPEVTKVQTMDGTKEDEEDEDDEEEEETEEEETEEEEEETENEGDDEESGAEVEDTPDTTKEPKKETVEKLEEGKDGTPEENKEKPDEKEENPKGEKEENLEKKKVETPTPKKRKMWLFGRKKNDDANKNGGDKKKDSEVKTEDNKPEASYPKQETQPAETEDGTDGKETATSTENTEAKQETPNTSQQVVGTTPQTQTTKKSKLCIIL